MAEELKQITIAEIERKMREYLAGEITTIAIWSDDITRDSFFGKDLGIDLSEQIESVVHFGEKFGVNISKVDADVIETVGEAIDLVAYVLEKKGWNITA